MEEIDKWKRINSVESIEDLKKAILDIAEDGIIMGKSRPWEAVKQVKGVDAIMEKDYPINVLTRSYGIRQQMMYLMYYE